MRDALYLGMVIHNRVRPVRHRLCYRVFSLLVDCRGLGALAARSWLFSHNRFNLFSIYDHDFGDGSNLEQYLAHVANTSIGSGIVTRFKMLCYPRILGYAFNPLTVYYGLDGEDHIRLVIYEVNNTFGERKSYAIPVMAGGDMVISQSCKKQLYVSPFNEVTGNYLFRLTRPEDELTVGVVLKDLRGPVLTAHFRGKREKLDDYSMVRSLARTGWVTVNVTIGIHYEALKLWWKGLSIKPRPAPPDAPVSYINSPNGDG